MECHHIVEENDGGANDLENCIPLCFDCHADMLNYDDGHPKGNKYRPAELRHHRDNWFERVSSGVQREGGDRPSPLDSALFVRILQLLPWEGSMRFISSNNFAGFSFYNRDLDQLSTFEARCSDPAWEFLDPTLESLRADLAIKISRFTSAIAFNTYPNGVEMNWVPQEWEYDQPEEFERAVTEIHESAREAVEAYLDFVREGRRRLDVDAFG
jgi:hypothetical protein